MADKKFRRVFVEITSACNLACAFCAHSSRPSCFMSVDNFAALAVQLVPLADMLSLHVLGEPFMHPQLPVMLSICSKLNLPVNLVTNGTLTEQFGRGMYEEHCLRQLSVSLHALAALSQEERTGKLSALIRLAKEKPRKLIISFRLRGGWGTPFGKETSQALLSAFDRTETPPGRHGGIKLADKVFLHGGEFFSWPGGGKTADRKNCLGLNHHFGILCTGEAIPCCMAHDGKLSVGNAFKKPLAELLHGPAALELRKSLSGQGPMPAYCAACGFRNPEGGAI